MSALTPALKRQRQALALAAAALITLSLGVTAVWHDASQSGRAQISGPVVPDWSLQAGEARAIEIIGPDTLFRLERAGEGWVMPSRGSYPVRPERIAELDAALSGLTFTDVMTRDADRFDRLGVGDPMEGGQGIHLRVLSGDATVLADLVIGDASRDGRLYLRRAGGARAYAARGSMPPLDQVDRWLGLDFLDLEPSSVARAQIRPETGPAYAIAKAGLASRNFELRAPMDWRLLTTGAVNGVAVAGSRVRFRDVRPASELTGPAQAGHSAVTFPGIAYDYAFFAGENDRVWALLSISAATDDVEDQVRALSQRVSGWAFEVSADAYERMTRPLDRAAEPLPPLGEDGPR